MGKGDYKKQKSSKNYETIEPFDLFLSGSAGVGKSHLVKTIHQVVSKLLQYHGTFPEKPRLLILVQTGVATINVNGATIHFALNLPCCSKLNPLDANTLTTMQNRFSEVKLIIIDEISMVYKKVLYQIHGLWMNQVKRYWDQDLLIEASQIIQSMDYMYFQKMHQYHLTMWNC